MPESKRKTEVLVGLFLFIGLALLGALIVQFGRFGDRFADTYSVTVVFDDAAGLIKGSEVRMGGARIGKVAKAPTLNEQVKVEVAIAVDERIHIPKGSVFQIASATLLGDKLIVITPPEEPTTEFIGPDSVIHGGGRAGLEAIQSQAESVASEASRVLADARETMKSIDAAVTDIRDATQELTATFRKVNTSVLSEENLRNVDLTLTHLENASADLGPTLDRAREAIASIEKAAEGARETFAEADARIAELEPALKQVPEAVAALSRAADQAAVTLDRVESGQGLIGTLAYDRQVSDDAKAFIRNLKRDGILRYRDRDNPEDDPRSRFRGRRR